MNKRLAVLAGAIALSVVPLTAQAQETPETTQMMPAAECGEHHATMGQRGHIGDMATMMGGDHIAAHARGEHGHHISHMASKYGQNTAAVNRGPRA